MRTLRLILTWMACFSALAPSAVADDKPKADASKDKAIPVRHQEGVTHGFLVLHSVDSGELIASGELLQEVHRDGVHSRMVLHFKDGSLHDETAVFSQRGAFRLRHYHLIQKGPSFPHPLEVFIEGAKREVTVHYTEDGQEKVVSQTMDLPVTLSNGFLSVLLKNVPADGETKLAMLAFTPKPQIVTLNVNAQGEDSFAIGEEKRKAIHYVAKIDIPGIKGAIAPLVGKKPPDLHIWITAGEAPTFARSEAPLFYGGPIWRMEMTSPAFP